MKIKCVRADSDWFTEGKIYEVTITDSDREILVDNQGYHWNGDSDKAEHVWERSVLSDDYSFEVVSDEVHEFCYKVGDKVRVVDCEEDVRTGKLTAFSALSSYYGKEVTIHYADEEDNTYKVVGTACWWFGPNMFVGFSELPDDIMSRLHTGDHVTFGDGKDTTVVTGYEDNEVRCDGVIITPEKAKTITKIVTFYENCIYDKSAVEKKKLTVAEISKLLGYDVEVVKG